MPDGNGTAVLEAVALHKEFTSRDRKAPVIAVDDVSFRVPENKTLAIVGESGCGKSTVGKLLLDLIDPDSGEILLRGQPVQTMRRAERLAYRRSVQMVFQNPLSAFNPMLTVGASLQDAMRLRIDLSRNDKKQLAAELLHRVHLEPASVNRFPSELSGGQLQRVGLARALASEPQAIFLDEPTSALDMSIRGQILELLLEVQESTGVALVLVTHDLRVVTAVADDVLVMYLGQVVEQGPADALLENPLHPYTRGLLTTTQLRPGARRLRVRGELTQLPPEYTGCRLYPRCPYRMAKCRLPQPLDPKRGAQAARCWRALDIEGEPPPEEPAESVDLWRAPAAAVDEQEKAA